MKGWEDSWLYYDWANAVKRGHPNDFVMCITASSKTGVSGTGKTTLETAIAKVTDLTSGGFDATEKASLDAGEIAYQRMPELEPRSTVVWDEAQGAPGTVGLDARRAMKQEAIDAISAILANRDKQFTIIITAQVFSMLDPRIYPMIDAWLLIRRGPDQPGGPIGTYHSVHVEDYDLSNPQVRTPGIEDFSWEEIPHDDPDYKELERLKQEAKTRSNDEQQQSPDEAKKEKTREVAQQLRNQGLPIESQDPDTPDIVSAVGMSQSWISKNTEPAQ